MKRNARILKNKAISSLRRGVLAFNGFDDDGRLTSILLHSQHAGEMLLKACLVQVGAQVFDKKTSKSKSFKTCLNLVCQYTKLTPASAGVLRAIDSLRDAEQHWICVVDEGILYTHIRALVTIFDELLDEVFKEKLEVHLPARVLPISTQAVPNSIDTIILSEFEKIQGLLTPGKRVRDEARGRIRTLLAMEAHVADEVSVAERDITRVERAIKSSHPMSNIFPRLSSISNNFEGEGAHIVVHFY